MTNLSILLTDPFRASESGIEAGELFVAQTQERVIWEFCELQFAATAVDGWLRQSGFVKQSDPAYAGCYRTLQNSRLAQSAWRNRGANIPGGRIKVQSFRFPLNPDVFSPSQMNQPCLLTRFWVSTRLNLPAHGGNSKRWRATKRPVERAFGSF